MAKLPFTVPGAKGRVQTGEHDSRFDLDGHEQIQTFYLGGPDFEIPEAMHADALLDADAVTVVARSGGAIYDVTYWRAMSDGG